MTEVDCIRIDEVVVDANGYCSTKTKRDNKANSRNSNRGFCILSKDVEIDFEADKEQEEDQTDSCYQVEIG